MERQTVEKIEVSTTVMVILLFLMLMVLCNTCTTLTQINNKLDKIHPPPTIGD